MSHYATRGFAKPERNLNDIVGSRSDPGEYGMCTCAHAY